MAAAAETLTNTQPGWLRSRGFDYTFVIGIAALALASGGAVAARPELFPWILAADLWLLGYHHVISTFTRLAFDVRSLREHWFFVFALPPLVFGATFAAAWLTGAWIIVSVYLYWQWFHYTRQSWGISQIYRAKSSGRVTDGPVFSKLCFYLVPLWGILYRSSQAPDTFLFLPLRVIPVPEILTHLVGAAAVVSMLVWGATRIAAWRAGTLSIPHTTYMVSHFTVFLVGYRLIEDITFGWLVINIWHNAQYILFVWLFNANRFRSGVDEKARFISRISQPRNFAFYVAVCLALTTIVYVGIRQFASLDVIGGLPMVIIAYQAINFHHYIVDSFIWKVRKRPLRQTLGLERNA